MEAKEKEGLFNKIRSYIKMNEKERAQFLNKKSTYSDREIALALTLKSKALY